MVTKLILKKMKKLKRNSREGIIAGVCEGLGEYFNIDPIIIRLLFFAFALSAGGGIITYIIAWTLIPNKNY